MKKHANDALDAMRALTTELITSIDAWSDREADPQHFRHRLLRAHALAVLDELEQLSAHRAPSQPAAAP
jgi:hypothetical protein